MIDHWILIWAAYAVTVIATAALTAWSFAAMRRAEAQADALRRER
jgi:heme exporter protein D